VADSDNIEDLVLEESSTIPDDASLEFLTDFTRTKLREIEEHLAANLGGGQLLRTALLETREVLSKHPEIVAEMLPEEIGIISRGLMVQTDKAIIDATTKKKKPGKKKKLSTTEIKDIMDATPDDF